MTDADLLDRAALRITEPYPDCAPAACVGHHLAAAPVPVAGLPGLQA